MTIYGIDRETIDTLDMDEVSKDWSRIAGANVVVKRCSGFIWAQCSELGALRLAHRHKHSENSLSVIRLSDGFRFVLREKKA